MILTTLTLAATICAVGDYLDREFDKVGRLKDGTISDAAVERYGFKWAVGKVREWQNISVTEAQELVKKVGWY